jgi:hypothetical protein
MENPTTRKKALSASSVDKNRKKTADYTDLED